MISFDYPAAWKEKTDEELVILCKDGETEAFSVLLSKYLPLIRYKINRFPVRASDKEDMIQESMIAFVYAIRGYKPEKQVGFKQYALVCIQNRILSAVQATMQLKQLPLQNYISLDTEDGVYTWVGEDTDGDPEALLIKKEELERKKQVMHALLSAFEFDVLMLYLKGWSYEEMASKLDVAPKSIDNALQRIRKKLRAVCSSD
ncbi:sigma-70 family RNA polymerase sigma factor [Candidatus Soleaferrea massiliensis]|uniref:sigma-70 family RNA polymerase sigma factor n=1 Tax=Candidatus Soleaferrea massiliensis TaxID=1470354 RepID=UPI00058D20F3|nr:sigma-70 family RNA polymerase sigma factor [Candidatus Soleaferrea massiliensis]